MMTNVWMVRSASGKLIDDFLGKGLVAIGFGIDYDVTDCRDKRSLIARHRSKSDSAGTKRESPSAISNMHRFLNEISENDTIVTYDPNARVYHIGKAVGIAQFRPDVIPKMPTVRFVRWESKVDRDALAADAKNSLGSLLTVFQISGDTAEQLLSARNRGRVEAAPSEIAAEQDEEDGTADLRTEVAEQAKEFVKDIVMALDWESVERLVAGILRAMGYKTRLTSRGSDLGRDIIASPDGLGFEQPRIIVEVKHRKGQMGAPHIRGFIGGLHPTDRGLYVSTGGFSKEARYEAGRANPPVTLLDAEELTNLLTEHYDKADSEIRALVPLTPIYWPIRAPA